MNSVKTKHYVNLRTAHPSLHSTTGYSMLSASVWSIVCKWLITVVPFYLEYSQQGGFQENSTGQHVQERAWFGEAKGKGYSLRVHDIVSHNLLYISTCWCPLCLCSLQRAHFSASISFIFSSILQLFFLFLLPCQSSIVLPICRHFVKPREIVFLSVRTLFFKLITDSPPVPLMMTDKRERNGGNMNKETAWANKTHIMQGALSCACELACLSEAVPQFCEQIGIQHNLNTIRVV